MPQRPRIMLISPRSDMKYLVSETSLVSRYNMFKVEDMADAPSSAVTSLPDLVILDLTNPAIDSAAVLKALKADERTSPIPIISMITRSDGEEGVKSLESGAADYLIFPCYDWELIARIKVHLRLRDYQEELNRKNRELEEFSDLLLDLNSRLEGMARKDELTHIWNRRAFNEHVVNIHNYSARYQHSYCIIMVDLDYFKAYNDTYGHVAGDRVLEQVASTLCSACRSTDFVARYGGEEFVILLPETDCSAVEIICDRILGSICSLQLKHEISPDLGLVTVSLGVSEYQPIENLSKSWEQVLRKADEALYSAKSSGRNRACFN